MSTFTIQAVYSENSAFLPFFFFLLLTVVFISTFHWLFLMQWYDLEKSEWQTLSKRN